MEMVMTKTGMEEKVLESLGSYKFRGLMAYLVPQVDGVQFTEVDGANYDSSFAAEVGGDFTQIVLAVGRLQERGEVMVEDGEHPVLMVSLP